MNFQGSLEYLLSLGNEVSTMKLGLDNIRKLLGALGDPQKKYPKVQVAGTNGKGSVCAFLNAICRQAGIRTGMYTSPHLVSITERIQIGGAEISEQDFARLATRVRETSETLVAEGVIENIPTFFEQVTAVALLAFAEAKVELAILETGLGGRLDATTAANAQIAAITRIDIDHQQYLGETIEEIAAEKAAIIHEGSRVVIGEQPPKAMEVILERCRSLEVIPTIVGGNLPGVEGVAGNFATLGLPGLHQIENARVAASIAGALRTYFPITESDIRTGLETARHPGRLEQIGRFILDGAHNIGGAKALRAYLHEKTVRPITLIFGAMNDKPVNEIANILFPLATTLILTSPQNQRALRTDNLLKIVPVDFDSKNVIVARDSAEAVLRASDLSGDGDLIVVTGSLYLVGEVRQILTFEPRAKLKFHN